MSSWSRSCHPFHSAGTWSGRSERTRKTASHEPSDALVRGAGARMVMGWRQQRWMPPAEEAQEAASACRYRRPEPECWTLPLRTDHPSTFRILARSPAAASGPLPRGTAAARAAGPSRGAGRRAPVLQFIRIVHTTAMNAPLLAHVRIRQICCGSNPAQGDGCAILMANDPFSFHSFHSLHATKGTGCAAPAIKPCATAALRHRCHPIPLEVLTPSRRA